MGKQYTIKSFTYGKARFDVGGKSVYWPASALTYLPQAYSPTPEEKDAEIARLAAEVASCNSTIDRLREDAAANRGHDIKSYCKLPAPKLPAPKLPNQTVIDQLCDMVKQSTATTHAGWTTLTCPNPLSD